MTSVLHLRLHVPDDLVGDVSDVLEDDDTVTDVVVMRDAYCKPPGTLVLADVARENATGVLTRLRELRLHHLGTISITEVDTILSDAASHAEQIAPGAPDDGVVWESVEQRLRDDSRLSWSFVAFMTLAALIAGVGRILDQPILIVGAMVVGPEFSAIAAICFALAHPRLPMLPVAARTLAVGFGIATAVATVIWSAGYALGAFTRHQASSGHLTAFIVHPNAWSFVVALLAGVAGTLSLTTAKSGPLVGVFISITTIPAVGTMAVCLSCGVWTEAASALAQLVVNLLGLLVAGVLTLRLQRLVWSRVGHRFHVALTRR